MNHPERRRVLRALLPAMLGASVAAVCGLPSSPTIAATAKPSGSPARASKTIGDFTWTADKDVTIEPVKGVGYRFTFNGNVKFVSPNRVITAQTVTVDVPPKSTDILSATASGNVEMVSNLADKRTLRVKGQKLVYDRASDKITVDGGVYIHSDMQDGGTADAEGSHAVVTSGAQGKFQTATLTGGVSITLVKPDTFDGPATFTGESLTVNLITGKFTLSGNPNSPTQGNFNLPSKSQKG
jgi:lipopolysaccharide export system protein LptA